LQPQEKQDFSKNRAICDVLSKCHKWLYFYTKEIGHIPQGYRLDDYNNLIKRIVNGDENEIGGSI
jgi:hypothetical protein